MRSIAQRVLLVIPFLYLYKSTLFDLRKSILCENQIYLFFNSNLPFLNTLHPPTVPHTTAHPTILHIPYSPPDSPYTAPPDSPLYRTPHDSLYTTHPTIPPYTVAPTIPHILPDLASRSMPLTLLCQVHSDLFYFIFPSVVYRMARYLCDALDSSIPQPTSWEDLGAIVAAIDSMGFNMLKAGTVWLPYNDIENEGVWRCNADENVALTFVWRDGKPNGFTCENCASLTRECEYDFSCTQPHVLAAYKVKDKSVFILHSSGKKQTYFLADQDEVGVLAFQDYEGSTILKVDGY